MSEFLKKLKLHSPKRFVQLNSLVQINSKVNSKPHDTDLQTS